MGMNLPIAPARSRCVHTPSKYGQRADQQQAAQGQREPNAEPKSNRYRPAENRNYSDQQRVGQLRSDMFNVMAAAGLR